MAHILFSTRTCEAYQDHVFNLFARAERESVWASEMPVGPCGRLGVGHKASVREYLA